MISDYAYGPQNVQQLSAGQGKDKKGKPVPADRAIVNADSFAWFVNVRPPNFLVGIWYLPTYTVDKCEHCMI